MFAKQVKDIAHAIVTEGIPVLIAALSDEDTPLAKKLGPENVELIAELLEHLSTKMNPPSNEAPSMPASNGEEA